MMRKLILIFLLAAAFPALLSAQSVQDTRRIEEEVRDILAPTEGAQYLQERPVSPAQESQYLNTLSLKPGATTEDALRVLEILLGPKADLKDYPGGQGTLRKGAAAVMFCRALNIRGGIWMRLFGASQRYALRELVFEGIMYPGSVNETVSGRELVIMLANSAEYLATVTPRKNRTKI